MGQANAVGPTSVEGSFSSGCNLYFDPYSMSNLLFHYIFSKMRCCAVKILFAYLDICLAVVYDC